MVEYKTIIKTIENYIKCVEWKTYEYLNSKGEEIKIKYREYIQKKLFRDALYNAYLTQDKDGWRVDMYDENGELLPLSNWDGCRMFVNEDGSTFAIREDGDIISVCKNKKIKNPQNSMKALMEIATSIEEGDRLDSFDGNWGFYRACGFEPVSWIHFNEEYAPKYGEHGWDRSKDKKEPIVFFKHTGKSKRLDENEMYEEKRKFYKDIVANTGDNAYGDAYSVRDDNMKY